MSSYKDLEIYRMSFELAIQVHKNSLNLPNYELYEQGSQIRRASKRIPETIAEGYGKKRYKDEFIRFLTFAIASGDEVTSQLSMIGSLYPEIADWTQLLKEYDELGKKINNFIKYVENDWRSKK
jgi:four helix bundle protein